MNNAAKHSALDERSVERPPALPVPPRGSSIVPGAGRRVAIVPPSHPRRVGALVLAGLVLALGAGACSKSSSPTAPYGGGGGTGGGNTGGTSFNFGPFAVGQSASFTFASAGTFGYHCIPHRTMGMVGSVQVDASGSDSAVVQIALSGLSFTPAAAHIKTGGHVRWVNASSSSVHTVTSD